jgi:CheY-like chemotaxis protein/HPt (histidine-containing phosphotransfer) domain-containing protein
MRPASSASGPAAVKMLKKSVKEHDPFEIAILDMQMPGMDGEMLGRVIKADSSIDSTTLVMMTSLGTLGEVKRFSEIGFSAYLTKPTRHQELRRVLALALSSSEQTAGLTRQQPSIVTRHSIPSIHSLEHLALYRILLAEDNITNQQVAIGILKKLGYQTTAVFNGREALEMVKSQKFHLILLDVQMPEMDGFETTKRIRRLAPPNRNIPIIAMTAHAMQGDREKCLAAGMDDYLSKPVTPKALQDILQRWLPHVQESNQMEPSVQELEINTDSPRQAEGLWDRTSLQERMMDDEELVSVVIQGFLDDIPIQIQLLARMLEEQDLKGAERQAHTIKGAAANVGAMSLSKKAASLEQLIRNNEAVQAQKELIDLQSLFEKLKEMMSI